MVYLGNGETIRSCAASHKRSIGQYHSSQFMDYDTTDVLHLSLILHIHEFCCRVRARAQACTIMGPGLGSRFGSLVIVLIFVSLWAAFLESKESRTAIGRSRIVGDLSIGRSQAHLSELVVSGLKGEADSLEEAITPNRNLRRDFNPFERRDDHDIWYVGVRSVPVMRPLITSKGEGIAVGH